MNEEERIAALFAAQPDRDYYNRREKISHASIEEIYIRGDEDFTEEGAYFCIATDEGYVCIARGMIEKLAERLQGVTFY